MIKYAPVVLALVSLSACVSMDIAGKSPIEPMGALQTPNDTSAPAKSSIYENVKFIDVSIPVEGTEGTLDTVSFHNKDNIGFTVQNKTRHVISGVVVVENDGAAVHRSEAMGNYVDVGGKVGYAFTFHPGVSKYFVGTMTMAHAKVLKDGFYQHTFRFENLKLGIRYPDNHPDMVKLFGTK